MLSKIIKKALWVEWPKIKFSHVRTDHQFKIYLEKNDWPSIGGYNSSQLRHNLRSFISIMIQVFTFFMKKESIEKFCQ